MRLVTNVLFLLFFINSCTPASTSELEQCQKLIEPKQEKCFQNLFSKEDKKLNQIYRSIMKNLTAEARADLKKSELGWIKYKEHMCSIEYNPEIKNELDRNKCFIKLTSGRSKFLQQAWGNPKKSLAGKYSDGLGGKLTIDKNGDFKITVVRGPTYHSGEVSGKFAFAPGSNKHWRSPKNCGNDIDECCDLLIISRLNRIEIIEKSCSYYHDARAYFDGIYRKIE